MRSFLLVLMIACLPWTQASADLYSEPGPGAVSVTSREALPFRRNPDFSEEPFLFLGPGLSVTLLALDEENNWAYVEIENGPDGAPVQGYVCPGSLMVGDYLYWDMCRVVNPESGQRLNLRNEPSVDSASLGKYYTGVYAENYHQEKNGYLRVRIGNLVGWMDKRYLEPYDSSDVSEITQTVIRNEEGSGGNLRTEPSLAGGLIDLYPNGTEVAVLGVTPNQWCHVMINGVTGFMMENKLEGSFSFKGIEYFKKPE